MVLIYNIDCYILSKEFKNNTIIYGRMWQYEDSKRQ